jgi:hypothetical protein
MTACETTTNCNTYSMFRCTVTMCLSVCFLSGCASVQLTRRTLDQAATFTHDATVPVKERRP